MRKAQKSNLTKIFVVCMLAICLVATAIVCGCANKGTNFTPTDYSNMDNWINNDYNNAEKKNTKADVIFIYGTNVVNEDHENGTCSITDEMKEATKKMDIGSTDAFNDGVRFYEPCYRQLSANYELTKMVNHDDLFEAIRTTEVETDLFAALDYYFKNYNEGRPFILAGYSQGGACVQVLLEDYFGQQDHKKYIKQMVAAYSIAYGVDKNWLEKLDYLKFATGAEDTGVVLSWNTEGVGEKNKSFLLADNPSDTLVINPINWKTDSTYAKAEECTGSYEGGIVSPGLYNLQIDAQRGSLICDNNTNYVSFKNDPIFGGKSLHTYELSEAYLNVRQNMHQRIDAFVANN